MKPDLVYPLKDCDINEELRYSLRSVEKHAKNYGKIINKNCGATNLEMLKNFVIDKGYDIGFAYDGDVDRIMVVSNNGDIVDGDDILYLLINYEYKNLH